MKVDLIIFDMAGTTVDEQNVVYKTVRRAINEAGYDFSQDQVQAEGAGKEKSQAIRDVLALDGATHSEDEVQQIFTHFKTLLAEEYADLNVSPQPQAEEVFSRLKEAGVKVALDTGYDRATAESLIHKLQWKVGDQIDALVTASDVVNGRPHADMILRAMEICQVSDATRVAKIGDSQIDIEEGKSAQCGFTYGITTGAQTKDQLLEANPSAVLDSLSELLDLLA